MRLHFLNFASVVVCVLFDLYGEDNSFHAYISFFIVDLPTGKSRKISDAAYLLAVSICFAVCSGTSMSWIKTYQCFDFYMYYIYIFLQLTK